MFYRIIIWLSAVFAGLVPVTAGKVKPMLPDCPVPERQIRAAEEQLLKNICTTENFMVKGDMRSVRGAVVASPSYRAPGVSQDYMCHWVREAALVMLRIARQYEQCTDIRRKKMLFNYLRNYIAWTRVVHNQPSRKDCDIRGEPKFNINGIVFAGKWQRPQNDGPALRALALMKIARILLKDKQLQFVIKNLYNPKARMKHRLMIRKDLDYIVKNCRKPSVGLWEEIKACHFFTAMIQRKALLEGAKLAEILGDKDAAKVYLFTAKYLAGELEIYWNLKLKYYAECISGGNQAFRGVGIDSAVVLAAVYGRPESPADRFAPDSDRMLSSAYEVRKTFERMYPVNGWLRKNKQAGPLIGRFPCDNYDGYMFIAGNPWIPCTCVFAQYYYLVAGELYRTGIVIVTPLNVKFFRQAAPGMKLAPGDKLGRSYDPARFNRLITALVKSGDGMLKAVKFFAGNNSEKFHLSEQIDRKTGAQVSAKDCSWSYTAFLDAVHARGQLMLLIKNNYDFRK